MPGTGLLLLVDLDGVLYRGANPVPGVAAVLADRAARGDDVVYVTNNSMWYRAEYVDRITGMGAPATADRIVSSPRATALYLRDHEPEVRHVLTVGASGLDRELEDAGFRVTRAGDAGERIRGGGVEGTDGGNGWEAAGRPDAVVVGLDPQIDYLRLTVANDCVRAGARFIATNRDPVYPTERAVRPGAGSIVAAIEAASGVTPISIGKPEPYLLEEAARAVGSRAGRGGDDRRRARDRHRGGRGGRGAEHPDADRRHDPARPTRRRIATAAATRELADPDAADRRRTPRRARRRMLDGCRPRLVPRLGATGDVGRSSGDPDAAQASKRRAREAARAVASSTKAWSSAARSIAQSSSAVSPISSSARSYSSVSDRSETVVSSVERVTGTPARYRRASG